MGDPAMDVRGLGDRGTANRNAVQPLHPPADYPPFSVSLLGFGGQGYIAHALAWALKWQLELMRAADPEEAKDLADKLIAIWEWLKEMEVTSPRAPDGALLVNDPLAVERNAKVTTKFVETETGDSILVTTSRVEAPLPVWQPTLFPPELPPDVKADYPARPTSVDDIPPFFTSVVERWMVASVRVEDEESSPKLPKPEPGETGVIVEGFEVLEPATELKEDEDESEKAMKAAERALDLSRWNSARLAAFKGVTPTVSAAVATLRNTSLADISRHTGVKFDSTRAGDPLINYTEYILYHSVCSFVLDKNGEPTDLRDKRDGKGLFDYPILIEGPGESMRRSTPADDGVYISVQRYGDSKFRINETGITKLLFGTVGGFTRYGYGDGGPHWIHERLQGYLDRNQTYGFVAGISVPGLYERREITWSLIKSRIPEFVDTVVPYLVKEVMARASRKLENWQAFAKEVLVSVIQDLILDNVRDKIRNYLIKKVGKRIVPGLNAVAALVDLFTGGTERLRMRNIIACMIVALRSRYDEDMHIAAKTCAKVVADEFEDAVMKALIAKSKKAAAKLKRKNKAQQEADEKAEADQAKAQPKAEPPPPKAPPPPPKADRPAPPPDPPKAPTAAKRVKQSDVAQPTDIKKHGAPRSVDVPTSNDGKKVTTASIKDSDRSPPKVAKDGPEITRIRKPATKEEIGWLERGRKKQEEHNARIAKKRKEIEDAAQKKKEEEQKLAANGGTATGNDGKVNTGTSNQSKGTESKGKESTGTGAEPPAKPNDPAKKPKKPPEPEPNYIHVKEPKPVADTQHVQKERADPTSSHGDVAVGRAQYGQNAGQMGIGEHGHHGMQKKGGGEAGDQARENAQIAGVSVNNPANMIPARGLSDDNRAVHGSSAPHSSMHGAYDKETMRQIAETRKHDPEGLKSAQADYNQALYEGRRPNRDTFFLGGDPPPKPPRKTKKEREEEKKDKETEKDPKPEE